MQFLNQRTSAFIYEFPKIPLLSENGMVLNAPVDERCRWWLLGNGWRNYFKDVVAGKLQELQVIIERTTSLRQSGTLTTELQEPLWARSLPWILLDT